MKLASKFILRIRTLKLEDKQVKLNGSFPFGNQIHPKKH